MRERIISQGAPDVELGLRRWVASSSCQTFLCSVAAYLAMPSAEQAKKNGEGAAPPCSTPIAF